MKGDVVEYRSNKSTTISILVDIFVWLAMYVCLMTIEIDRPPYTFGYLAFFVVCPRLFVCVCFFVDNLYVSGD